MNKKKIDRYYWPLLALSALGALGLGLYGWYTDSHISKDLPPIQRLLEIIYYALSPLTGEGVGTNYDKGNYFIPVSRILAIITLLGAAIRVVMEVFIQRLSAFRMRRQKGHTVIIGSCERAMEFLLHERRSGNAVILVDAEESDALETVAHLNQALVLHGDARDSAVLKQTNIGHAQKIIIISGLDTTNLAIFQALLDLSPQKTGEKSQVFIELKNFELKDDLNRLVSRIVSNLEIYPFDIPTLAARDFVWSYPLYNYADLMNQKTVHCVFLGVDLYAYALLAKMATSFQYRDQGLLKISLIVDNVQAVKTRLAERFGRLSDSMDITVRAPDGPIGDCLLSLYQEAPITSLLVFKETDEDSLQAVLTCQFSLRLKGADRFPFYVRLNRSQGIQSILNEHGRASHFGEVVEAFGIDAQICNTDKITGALEQSARRLHEKYQESSLKNLSAKQQQEKRDNFVDWIDLDETLKSANRRAIDHLPAKLASSGCMRPSGFDLSVHPSFSLYNKDQDQLERLCALEHASWKAGRSLDGWRGGDRRDNWRRLNPIMDKDYVALDAASKAYNEDQIKMLDTDILIRDKVNGQGRQELIVGLIGHLYVSQDDYTWLKESFETEFLPDFLAETEDYALTLLSSLAPGSDMILTTLLTEALDKAKRPYRLIVPEGVPQDILLSEFAYVLDQDDAYYGQTMPPATRDESLSLIKDNREAIITKDTTEWKLSLYPIQDPQLNSSQVQEGFVQAADYITFKSHCLLAFCRSGSQIKPGGTAYSLAERTRYLEGETLFRWTPSITPTTIQFDPLEKRCLKTNHPLP